MHTRILSAVLVLLVLVLGAPATKGAGAAGSPHVVVSTGGMEGLSAVKVQVHLSGGEDLRDLIDLDEKKLEKKIQDLLKGTPGLAVVEGQASANTPRVLVMVVGHLIADPDGNKDTAAVNISVSLNQSVAVRRSLPTGQPIITNAMTWNRNLLLTGLTSSMKERVQMKLDYLMGQLKGEYLRVNAAKQ